MMDSWKFTRFLYHVRAPLTIRNKNLCFSKHRLNGAILSLQLQMIRSWFSLLLTNGKTIGFLGRMKKGGFSLFAVVASACRSSKRNAGPFWRLFDFDH